MLEQVIALLEAAKHDTQELQHKESALEAALPNSTIFLSHEERAISTIVDFVAYFFNIHENANNPAPKHLFRDLIYDWFYFDDDADKRIIIDADDGYQFFFPATAKQLVNALYKMTEMPSGTVHAGDYIEED